MLENSEKFEKATTLVAQPTGGRRYSGLTITIKNTTFAPHFQRDQMWAVTT